jgi:hypothetical protein
MTSSDLVSSSPPASDENKHVENQRDPNEDGLHDSNPVDPVSSVVPTDGAVVKWGVFGFISEL